MIFVGRRPTTPIGRTTGAFRWLPRAAIALVGMVGCHCGHGGGAQPSHTSEHVDGSRPGDVGDGVPPSEGVAANDTAKRPIETKPEDRRPQAPERIVLAMATHRAHAELRHGRTLIMDLGTPGGHKYDFGGWLSGSAEDRVFADTQALLAKGKHMRLAFPADMPNGTVSLRLRSFTRTKATLYLNGKRLGGFALGGSDFETQTLQMEAPQLRRGENELLLRVAQSAAVPGGGRSGFAIDWVRIGPQTTAQSSAKVTASPGEETPTPSEETQSPSGNGSMTIAADHSLAYVLEVPAGARLRLNTSPAEAALAVTAEVDGAPSVRLHHGSPKNGTVDLDLSPLSGQIARLTLSAGEVALEAHNPRIVTLGSEGDREHDSDPHGAASSKVDNVLIVLIDTLRADRLQAFNRESRVQTPGLAAFVEHAAILTNARTQENWTKPSVATLLSSLLPWQHNASSDASKVPRSVELLPELLRERGFYTGSFIANGYVSDKFGFKQGWHTYRNYIREGRRAKAQYVAADVLDWLDERPKDKPFFLYMHTIDPHVPYKPPSSFLEMYDDEPYRGPVDFRASATLLERIKVGKLKLNRRDKRRLEALYDAEISYHDVHFAAVLRGLEQRGLADNTMVVVTADHGEEFWDHGSVGHGHSVYDELLHVPMVVKIPGVTHGALKLNEAVGLVDVMPTVLEALGQQVPEHLSGTSMLPLLQGRAPTAPPVTVSGFMRGWRTLAVGRLKLVQRTLGRWWLYNTLADPGEQRDIADESPIALRYTRGQLGLALAAAEATPSAAGTRRRRKRKHRKQDVHIDADTQAQLEALGYVGTSKPK